MTKLPPSRVKQNLPELCMIASKGNLRALTGFHKVLSQVSQEAATVADEYPQQHRKTQVHSSLAEALSLLQESQADHADE